MRKFVHACTMIVLSFLLLGTGTLSAQESFGRKRCSTFLANSADVWMWLNYDLNFSYRRAFAKLFKDYALYNRSVLRSNDWAILRNPVLFALQDNIEFIEQKQLYREMGLTLVMISKDLQLFDKNGQIVHLRVGDRVLLKNGLVETSLLSWH